MWFEKSYVVHDIYCTCILHAGEGEMDGLDPFNRMHVLGYNS